MSDADLILLGFLGWPLMFSLGVLAERWSALYRGMP